ncbi:MAG TPA: hypothetical protein VMV49_18200, partial [Candidatus Deferrimicrobium sp.]|nr:hypothetical protein [Candidatus Deferrimicrobium sp.]
SQIWVNGTATDGTGSGLQRISIEPGLGSLGITWSQNLGSNTSWAFTNTSIISIDKLYWVIVNVTDHAGNIFHLNCTFWVEINPPTGTQDHPTTLPQNGGFGKLIRINGTAFDSGSGVKNVSISDSNITGIPFTSNLGSPSQWGFHNSSAIADGVWSVVITIYDYAQHCINLTGIIIIDTVAPAKPVANAAIFDKQSVNLSWAVVTDKTLVTYYIYRNNQLISNTTLLGYIDANLSAGTYNYYILPIDAAGNVGFSSEIVTVSISGGGNNLIMILIFIIIGIAAVSIGLVVVQRRKKSPTAPPRAPLSIEGEKIVAPKLPIGELEESLEVPEEAHEPPTKIDTKMIPTETDSIFEKLMMALDTEEKPIAKPIVPKEVEKEPADESIAVKESEIIRAERPIIAEKIEEAEEEIEEKTEGEIKKEAEEITEEEKPKVIKFTYYCSICKKWYSIEKFAVIDCPKCNNPLKLSYYCSNCKKRFMVKQPGTYVCPACKSTELIP